MLGAPVPSWSRVTTGAAGLTETVKAEAQHAALSGRVPMVCVFDVVGALVFKAGSISGVTVARAERAEALRRVSVLP